MAQQPHPPFPALPERGSTFSKYMHTAWFLENDAALSRLIHDHQKLDRKLDFPTEMPDSLKQVQVAMVACQYCANDAIRHARATGELLFCWHGTKATEVCQ